MYGWASRWRRAARRILELPVIGAALVPVLAMLRRARQLVFSRAVKLARRVRRRWSRSMRLRVIATTVLLSTVVVIAVGDFLLIRIRDGLIESRQKTAMAEAQRLTSTARAYLAAALYSSADTQEATVNELMGTLEASGGSEGRGTVLRRAMRSKEPSALRGSSSVVSPSVIPKSLQIAINESSQQKVQLTSIPTSTDAKGKPALAVGSVIDIPLSGPYELYFVFPLDREQQILDLVRRTFLFGGIGLVLLVGGVAFVVTRQVVTPVRQAARTAEELASGNLDRRMKVRGQDDIARLGRAFNGMAASLERQIHQLEELSRVQRQFVSDVSHELRTPLTTIRMASEVIYEGRHDLDPVLSRSAELLQAQIDRFDSLLADLLEISRFDAGAAALDIDTADVRDLVERVVSGLAPLAERKGSRMLLDLPGEACTAQIDPRRVERVVRNLVGNAIEHGEGRPIEVRVGISPEAVAVSVRDHGVGIDSAGLNMVFNRFWRADPARARNTGGSGLGLAIAQEDSHLHGGWLQAWGEPGRGAVFRLTIPREVGAILIGSPLPLAPQAALTAGEVVPQLEKPGDGAVAAPRFPGTAPDPGALPVTPAGVAGPAGAPQSRLGGEG